MSPLLKCMYNLLAEYVPSRLVYDWSTCAEYDCGSCYWEGASIHTSRIEGGLFNLNKDTQERWRNTVTQLEHKNDTFTIQILSNASTRLSSLLFILRVTKP